MPQVAEESPSELILKPHQRDFVDAFEQYLGLFGGVGNGKTTIACLKILEHTTINPNNLCLVGRLTYPELRDSTREVFMTELSRQYPPSAYRFNKAENSVTFPAINSTIIFRHLDNKQSLLGPNLGAFYIDQAEEVDEDVFLTLQGRLRRKGVKRRQGLLTGQPQGHNWIYYKYGMDKANDAKDWSFNTDYRMLTASTFANKDNLPPGYIEQLQRSYSPEWFNRYVLGSWDVFEGQTFDLTKITGYDKLPEIMFVVTACDPAISKNNHACNTSFTTLGVGKNGHIYDLETIADKWSFFETLKQAEGIISRHRSNYLGVESVGYQKALVEACQRYFPNLYVVDLKADKDKFRRARSVSHMIAKGLFHTNNRELLDEISAFVPDAPATEKKDRVDSFVHALHMIQMYAPVKFEPTSAEVEKKKFAGKSSGEIFLMKSLEEEKAQAMGDSNVINFDSVLQDKPANPEFY